MAIKKIHTVKEGENVALIASNYQITVSDIVGANPNVFTQERYDKSNAAIADGELVPGGLLIYPKEILKIPTGEIDDIAQKQAIEADNSDDLAIFIDGQRCPNPNTFIYTEYFDTCSDSFQIEYPYGSEKRLYDVDPERYKTNGLPDIKIYIGEDPTLSGQIEKVGQSFSRSDSTQSLGGRTKTRLLEKSEILPNVQADFINLKLDEIARIICNSHGIKLEIESNVNVGDIFEKVTRKDNETGFSLISRLARARKLIVSNTPDGNCLIRKAVDNEPVARFNVNDGFLDFIGVEKLDFEFDTTKIYGNYIGKTQSDDDDNATATASSSFLVERSAKRFNFKDVLPTQLQELAEREEQKSIRDLYKNTIPYPNWINPENGLRWKTGQVITLLSLEAGIKTERRLIIKRIDFTLDNNDKRTANLNFVPIEVYG